MEPGMTTAVLKYSLKIKNKNIELISHYG